LDDTQPISPLLKKRRFYFGAGFLAIAGLLITGVIVFGVLLVVLDEEEADSSEPIPVTLQIGGETQSITTNAETVAELLEERAIHMEPGDVLSVGLTTKLKSGMTIELTKARTVAITVDGQTSILRTLYENPQDILESAGIDIRSADRILLDGAEADINELILWNVPVMDITIQKAISVRIIDGDEVIALETVADTVGDALSEAGVTLYLADSTQPDLGAQLTDNLVITIDRSKEIAIIADGERLDTRVSGETVLDALVETGVTLAGLDYTVPSEETSIAGGMSVRVIRVTEEIVTEQDIIDFETVFQADAELTLDQRVVAQAGQQGIVQRTVRVRYENGAEISRTTEEEQVVQAVANRVVNYGTNIVVRTLDTPDGPVEYWRVMRVYATSYHPAALGGDNITSIGETLRKGIVAIDPRIIPYGTRTYVEGYGVGVAADTGGPRSSPYWIDLGYSDEDFEGWSRMATVYLLTPVPDDVNYLLPESYRGGPIP
jgi:uncharacterized protein YabE (DUF348 family)